MNTDVTVTKTGFVCGDMPAVVAAKCLKRRKKTVDEDERHLTDLRHKLQKQHDVLMTALEKAPKYENQIWAVEEQLKKKKIASEQKDLKELKNAQAEERARQEKLAPGCEKVDIGTSSTSKVVYSFTSKASFNGATRGKGKYQCFSGS